MKNKNFLSIVQWKTLLVLLALSCFTLEIWAGLYWERAMSPAMAGDLLAELGPSDRDYRNPIIKLQAASPLAQAGAKVGDRLVFEHAGDRSRQLGTDETIAMTLYSAQGSRHIEVRPIANPAGGGSPLMVKTIMLSNWAIIYLSLLIAVLTGWRRADDGAMRAFALALLANSFESVYGQLPGGAIQTWLNMLVKPAGYLVANIAFIYFTLTFPTERPHFRLAWVRRLFYIQAAAFLLFSSYVTAQALHLLPWSLREHTRVDLWGETMVNLSVVFSLTALWFSWRASQGATRQRLAWIGVCMGVVYAVHFIANLNGTLGDPLSGELYLACQIVAIMLAYCGLAYALLRHRLFDFGFAVNRALVFTIISTMLLIVFSFTEWAVDKLLHFEGREKNVIFDAGVALAIILSFHRIQHWVRHKVDHTFFHHWYEAAEKLRHFLDKAAHIADAAALQNKFVRAVEQFAGADGAAVYLLDARQSFTLAHSTLPGAPATLDQDDDVVIDMRHGAASVDLSERRHAVPGELALPMMVRGELTGLVLSGAKAGGQQYRPDEIALLRTGVRQLGLDLETLRLKALERHAALLTQKTAELEQKAAAYAREADALRQIINGGGQLQAITQ
ncbi:hypothetical protein ACFOLJ_29875 [Rugamonas sp. CCM 8940]|uniref:hypothetical protein n=1 Tax=Rugamonas sp. CCM 8940 TaxID=2765359 RepID=UPI0018F4C0EE|nr:hypothetical protein [Rugamonas sp. CCM 8940]MBJ7313036.1 hypothetical protein [Rugamonas sp. CCM 8940]